MPEFCYSVLPKLRGMINVREHDTEQIEKYLPPEAEPVFYLDNDNGLLTCRAAVRYGNTEYRLSDSMQDAAPGSRRANGSAQRDIQRESEALDVLRQYFSEYDQKKHLFITTNGFLQFIAQNTSVC